MEISVVPSKEMEANQPANPESGEGHNQHAEAGTECDISISATLEERFRRVMDSDAPVKEKDGHFIGQIPMVLRKNTELQAYFKPRIVSIGPVHHGEEELEQGQQYKLQLTKLFIEDCTSQSPEILYNNILNKEIANFKRCYGQQELLKFHGNDEDLAWMCFVDGCALIQFVKHYVLFWWIAFYYMNIDRDQVNIMATDLILLDNQLPLGVLNLIMEFINEEDDLRILILDFAKKIMEMTHFEGREMTHFEGRAKDLTVKTGNHMLGVIWMNFVEKKQDNRSHTTVAKSRHFPGVNDPPIIEATSHFLGVKDLQAAGIVLEPKNYRSSLRDISFNRGIFFAKLKIPSLRVSEQVKFLIFNLIAFEMHPTLGKDQVVTSYISFLNSLIASKEDVVELRKARILISYLPNVEEVFKTLQELTSGFKPHLDIFSSTKEEFINYFNDKKSMRKGKWLSEAVLVYFKSPWTIYNRFCFCNFSSDPDNYSDRLLNFSIFSNCWEWVTSIFNIAGLNLRKNG